MSITIEIVNRENDDVERIVIPHSVREEEFNRLLNEVAAILATI